MGAPGRHVVLYDGDCGLCNRLVRFVALRDVKGAFRFAPLQGAWARATLARHGKEARDSDTMWVVRDSGSTGESVLDRSEAATFILARLRRPWSLAARLAVLRRTLLDAAYDLVARHRHRLWRPVDRCDPLPAEVRSRLVDEEPSATA